MEHLQHQHQRTEPQDWVTRSIELEGCRYQVRYSPSYNQIELTQPPKILIGYRNTIGNHFPEVVNYETSGLDCEAIAEMVIMDKPKGVRLINGDGSDVRMPIAITEVKEVQVGRSKFMLGYDRATDLLVIHVPERIIRTSVRGLTTSMPEVKVLHDGRLLEEIEAFIYSAQQDELDFNPHDVF